MERATRHLLRIVLVVLVAIFAAACQDQSNDPTPQLPTIIPSPTAAPTETATPTVSPTPPVIPRTNALLGEDQAYFRIIHALPGIEAVDAYIEARNIAFRLEAGQVTEPAGIEAGTYTVRVQPYGTRLHEVTPYYEGTLTINGGDSLILIFTGSPDAPTLVTFSDDTDPLDGNQSRVSLIHAIPRGPKASILYVGSPLSPEVDFGQESESAVIPSGDSALAIVSGDQTILTTNINLQERSNYRFILMGRADDLANAKLIEVRTRVAGRATIRFINAATQVGTVDTYLNGELFQADVDTVFATERRTIAANTYQADIYAQGITPDDGAPIASIQFNANEDDDISLLFVGIPDNNRLVRFEEDLSPVLPGQLRIRFANALPGVPSAQILADHGLDAIDSLSEIAYRQVSEPITLDAGTYEFVWNSIANGVQGETVETAENVILNEGRNYLYALSGNQDPSQGAMLFEEPLVIDPNAVSPDDLEPTATPASPAKMIVANLIENGERVDFYVDGALFVEGMTSGQITEPVIIFEGPRTITTRLTGSDEDLAILNLEFMPGDSYNIYAVGRLPQDSSILAVRNQVFVFGDDTTSRIRMINVSSVPDVHLTLWYKRSDPQAPIATIEPTQQAQLNAFREPLPGGSIKLSDVTDSLNSSPFFIIPPGEQDIIIVDPQDDSAAVILRGINILPNTAYDIITYQDLNSTRITAYVLSYPRP